jgi:membrane protein
LNSPINANAALRQEGKREAQPTRGQPGNRPVWKHVLWNPKALWGLLTASYSEWSADKVPRMGAALAYYTIFSLAPLLIVAIGVAGLVFGEKAAQGAIVGQIQDLVGQDSAKAIQTMIQAAHKPATSGIASVIAIIFLLVGASGVFAELQDALNTIWEVKPNPKGGVWQFIKSRLLSFGMVLGVGFLLLVSFSVLRWQV